MDPEKAKKEVDANLFSEDSRFTELSGDGPAVSPEKGLGLEPSESSEMWEEVKELEAESEQETEADLQLEELAEEDITDDPVRI